jgi:hypothetical protein
LGSQIAQIDLCENLCLHLCAFVDDSSTNWLKLVAQIAQMVLCENLCLNLCPFVVDSSTRIVLQPELFNLDFFVPSPYQLPFNSQWLRVGMGGGMVLVG